MEISEIIRAGSPYDITLLLDEFGDVNRIYSEGNGHAVLHDAVITGEIEKVKAVLERKPNLEIRSRNKKYTPLHTAVINDHVMIIDALLDAGANIEATASDGLNSLHLASMCGLPGATSALLRRGAAVHATEVNGATPLHFACFHGFTEVVRMLLEKGADPDRKDWGGLSPRVLAQRKGHSAILSLLGDQTLLGEQKEVADNSSPNDRMAALESLAKNGLIVSTSRREHFANIVREMDALGATRSGSRVTTSPDGLPIIVDIYVLPNGKTLLAGYPNTH
jgi:ankyrin repeat protein